MRSIFKGLLAAAALAALACGPVHAGTVNLTEGGGWNEFFFGAPGFFPDFQDISGNTLDFQFTLTHSSVLRVTDGFNDGDQFDVTINGVDKGPTSPGIFSGVNNVLDCWSCAFYTDGATYSHEAYYLAAGVYDVTGVVIQSPFGAGAGAISLGAVPEPATWAMMLTGFFGLGAVLRRSRRTGAALA